MSNAAFDRAVKNLADHSESVLLAHGVESHRSELLWTNPHNVNIPYPNVITLGGEGPNAQLDSEVKDFLKTRTSAVTTGVCDSRSVLNLKPFGLGVLFTGTWAVRLPAPVEVIDRPDLDIVPVTDPSQLAEFERVHVEGFETEWADRLYPESLLNDSRYRFYLGRSDGVNVSGVLTFNNGDTLGVYTLMTIPSARRNGFAEALVPRALASDPKLPAITNPSAMSRGMFERLGFEEVGQRTVWLSRP